MPSTQMESELWTKNGLPSKLRQRLDDAAAGAEQHVVFFREADLHVAALGKMRLQLLGVIMHVDDDHRHARLHQAIDGMIDQRLAAHFHERLRAIERQGAHARAEAGRHDHRARDGFFAHASRLSTVTALLGRKGAFIPCFEIGEGGMFEIAVEIVPYARQIAEIARLAVALEETGEDADDLGVALGREQRHLGAMRLFVERPAGLGHGVQIMIGHRVAQVPRHVAARIFHERDDVVAARACHRILEIDHAHARNATRVRAARSGSAHDSRDARKPATAIAACASALRHSARCSAVSSSVAGAAERQRQIPFRHQIGLGRHAPSRHRRKAPCRARARRARFRHGASPAHRWPRDKARARCRRRARTSA